MKGFYVDLVRGARFSLLAGPFPSEAIARKYEKEAVGIAVDIDPFAHFDRFGVVSIEGFTKVGILNDRMKIEPADLLAIKERVS